MQTVEYIKGDIITVSEKMIWELKKKAKESPTGRYRYCFHKEGAEGLQEMVFALNNNSYLRPHKHEKESETQVLLDGKMLVLLFDENGEIKQIIKVEPGQSWIYRIEKAVYHMNLLLTEQVVIYEVRNGGFHSDTNIFPIWAPAPEDKIEVAKFLKNLEMNVNELLKLQ